MMAEKLAEARGFEPPVPVSEYNDLANRRLKPLGHASVAESYKEGPSRYQARDRAVRRLPRPRCPQARHQCARVGAAAADHAGPVAGPGLTEYGPPRFASRSQDHTCHAAGGRRWERRLRYGIGCDERVLRGA